jgi:hypothetical protein
VAFETKTESLFYPKTKEKIRNHEDDNQTKTLKNFQMRSLLFKVADIFTTYVRHCHRGSDEVKAKLL